MVGPVIVNEGKVVRPSQLIASVRRLVANGDWRVKSRKHRRLKSSITGKLTQRLGKVRQSKGQTHVGFAWYQRDQWARLRELAADAEGLEENYDAWLTSAERTLETVKSEGLSVERVLVDVEEIARMVRSGG